jgi:hypothetical protein
MGNAYVHRVIDRMLSAKTAYEMDRAKTIADSWRRNYPECSDIDFWLAYEDLQRRLEARRE